MENIVMSDCRKMLTTQKLFNGGIRLEKKVNLLLGIVGAILLMALASPLISQRNSVFNGFANIIPFSIMGLIAIAGLAFYVYFSVLLIIDAIKARYKK